MREKAEDCHAVLSADIDFAVDDQGRNELVAIAEAVAARRSLIAVVELVGEVGRVVGVKHASNIGVRLQGPDDAVLRSVGGDGGSCAGVLELDGRCAGGGGRDARVGDGESFERVSVGGIIGRR